jgi:hypothetical protein
MRWTRRTWRNVAALVLGSAAVLVVLALALAAQPLAANTFGYALDGKNSLPNQFTYLGMRYGNAQLCAGASTCDPAKAERWTQPQLDQHGLWPLKPVTTIGTYFGAPHPVYEPVNDPSMSGTNGPAANLMPWMLFVPDGDGAYFLYMRPGGP